MKTRFWMGLGSIVVAALASALLVPLASQAQAPIDAEALFVARCKACHDPADDRAPTRSEMAQRSAADILTAMTDGPMQPMAAGMKPEEIRALATYLSRERAGGNPLSAGAAPRSAAAGGGRGGGRGAPPAAPATADQMCAVNPPIKATATDWSSWGVDLRNTRFQRNPGFKAADVPKLKIKWTFSVRGGVYGQPTVVGDWLFLTLRSGDFYALDPATGCVRWKTNVVSRTTPMIAKSKVSPSGWVTYVGDRARVVHAYDAQTGKELWKSAPVEDHPSSGITGPLLLVGDQVFVPTTSGEEGAGNAANYKCCSFRGSLVALDARTGAQQWKTFMITEPMGPTRKNTAGTQLQGPAGAAIWSSPTADPKRGLVYMATGDSYTDAPTKGADAIVALEMKTGKLRWNTQVTEDDNFLAGCTRVGASMNCPNPSGPDYDFGAPPILFDLPGGKQIILAGQKSGVAYGLDPDTGKEIWRNQVGTGSSLGGIEWGMAVDGKRLYATNSDIMLMYDEAARAKGEKMLLDAFKGVPKPGVTAIDPATGKTIWFTPTPKAPCKMFGDRSRDRAQGCFNASSQAASVMPGVVFSGSTDGWMRAYESNTGKIIWEFSATAQQYDTVNGVKGQPGGGFDSMGVTLAGGRMFAISGFAGSANIGSNPLNVLIAFSPDGK